MSRINTPIVETKPTADPALAVVAKPAVATTPGVKKLSFAGIAKKKDDTKTAYPVFPREQNPQVYDLAERIIQRDNAIKGLQALKETDQADVRALVLPFYYATHHGKLNVPTSVSIPASHEVLVSFINKYPAVTNEAQIRRILGDQFDTCFRQKFTIEIDGDKLPADTAQELIQRLQTLFAEFNAVDALTVKDEVRPCADFHARRHIVFTPDTNLALAAIYPSQINVAPARGRK